MQDLAPILLKQFKSQNASPLSYDAGCVYCKALILFNGLNGLSELEDGDFNEQDYWKVFKEVSELRDIPAPSQSSIRCSRSITVEKTGSLQADHITELEIPAHVLKWIFYIELSVCYQHCLILLMHLDLCRKNKCTSLIDIYSRAPKSLRYEGLLTNPLC
jgi:hypothetical protein